jgi:hypothetical protein
LKINLGFHALNSSILLMNKISGVLPMIVAGLLVDSQADVIGSTSFGGRTLATVATNNDTASGLVWSVVGIADPGDLTAVPNQALANGFAEFEQNGLFGTPAGMNAFIPDLNIHNEGSYYVDIPIVVTATDGLTLESLSLTGIITNNFGELQAIGREVDFAVEVFDSPDAILFSDFVSGQDAFVDGGAFDPVTVKLDLGDVALANGASAFIRLYIGADGVISGNNAGFDDLVIEGSFGGPPADPRISAPSSFEFGRLLAFPTAPEFTIDISNLGTTQTLTIENTELSGADADRFEVISAPANLAPGATGQIVLRIDTEGTEVAGFGGVLLIMSNDPLGPLLQIALGASINAPGGDSDQDGLTDEAEVNGTSDPRDPDTDNDGLNDGDEVNLHKTDPLKADSDEDGFSDPIEIDAGTDPLDENDFPDTANLIASTDFDGRTLITTTSNNDTVTGLVWTVNGVADPGDLTAVPDTELANGFGQFQANGLFQTDSAINSFVPNLNIHNEGSYYVDVPLNAIAQLSIEGVSLTVQTHNNGGALQGVGREVDVTVVLLDSEDKVIAEDLISGQEAIVQAGDATPVTVEFDLGGAILPSGTANRLRISVGADGALVGNNAGFDDLVITGSAGPGAGLTITSITRNSADKSVTIIWNSFPGRIYSVETSSDLESWIELDDEVDSQGETTEYTEQNVISGEQRFYRVILQ